MNTQNTLPSIRNRFVLVSLTFNKPAMTKLDRKATADAENANNAHGALRTQKMLYPKHLIDPIVSIESEARRYLRTHTVELGNTGLGLLPLDNTFFAVQTQMGKYELERRQLVTVFANNWSNVLIEAASQQGALFDPSAYPDISQVVSQFGMTYLTFPVGELGGGMFDQVEKELADAVTEQISTSAKQALTSALVQPYTRLIEAVLNIYDKTVRDNSRIHDSLLETLDTLLDIIPALNVTNDTTLNQLAAQCRNKILPADGTPIDIAASILRDKDSTTRAEVRDNSAELLATVGLDPVLCRDLTEQERKDIAQKTAEDIVSRMSMFN